MQTDLTQEEATDLSQEKTTTLPKEQVDKQYKRWRFRITYSVLFGYAAFYLVRNNVNIAAPAMLKEFNLTKMQIGWVFSLFAIIYGVAKFTSGTLCDRLGVRYLMPIGLLGAAVASFLMGNCSSIVPFAVIYALSAFFQSTGWPALSRQMTQWFTGKQLGTRWGVASSSMQIGNTLILLVGPMLLAAYSWRSVFIIPGILCAILAVVLFERLRDNPQSLGLPSVEEYDGVEGKKKESSTMTTGQILKRYIWPNTALWFMSLAVFFVYLILKGFFNWAPTFIQETRGVSLASAGMQTAIGELAGLFAGLFFGWLSGRVFSGRRAILCGYVMFALGVMVIIFKWYSANFNVFALDMVMWGFIGFLGYATQLLSGLIAAELGFRKAAGTAAGFAGVFGYLGSSVAGAGVGFVVDNWGWNTILLSFSVCAFLGGACCFISEYFYQKTLAHGGL